MTTSDLSAADTGNAKSVAASSYWHQQQEQLLATMDHHWSSSSVLSYASYRMEKRGAWRCSHGYHLQPQTLPTSLSEDHYQIADRPRTGTKTTFKEYSLSVIALLLCNALIAWPCPVCSCFSLLCLFFEISLLTYYIYAQTR